MTTRILFFTSVFILLFSGCLFHFPGSGRLQLIAETDIVNKDEQERITKQLTQRLEGLGIDADDIEIHHIQRGMSVTILQYSDYDDIELKRIRYAVESGRHFALWETYLLSEVDDMLVAADSVLSDSLRRENTAEKKENKGDAEAEAAVAMDGGGISRYADRLGSSNSPLLRDVATYTDGNGNPAEDALLGIVNETDTAKVMQLLQLPMCKACFPPGLKFAWGRPHYLPESGTPDYFLIALKKNAAGTARIPDPVIAKAEKYEKRFTDPLKIRVRFDKPDVEKWAAMTRQNTGRDIAFAIDNYVVSTLRITHEITDGEYMIAHLSHIAPAADIQHTIDGGPTGCSIKVVSVENYPR